MKTRACMLAIVAAAMLTFGSQSAEARGPGMGPLGRTVTGYYSGNFGYYNMLWRLYNTSHVPVPPYFALQPPVYYSQPVPRPYGWGPYAYPRWIETPAPAPAVKPAMVNNPFVAPKESKPDKGATAGMIFNPYAMDAAGLATR
ncbi:MAG: hypothetical protein MI757_16190 [Pirellulales bacterium]|nr:hypothetical protein [Pirellulales bacterium]